jgi:glutamine amidotransferase
MLVAVINSQTSNIDSLLSALEYLQVKYEIINNYKKVRKFTHLILPGVGSFGYVMRALVKNKLDKFIYEGILKKKKFLGICLGMELLFKSSSEDKSVKGLNLLSGNFKKFSKKIKCPHIGFNYVYHDQKGIWKGIKNPAPFYFAHSYRIKKNILKNINFFSTFYGEEFVSFVNKSNIFGVQFHPEKSHQEGLKFIKNFLNEV